MEQSKPARKTSKGAMNKVLYCTFCYPLALILICFCRFPVTAVTHGGASKNYLER